MTQRENGTGFTRSRLPPRGRAERADRKLVSRVADGHLDALAELYDRYATVAFGLARAVLQDDAQAERAVEEGLLDAWHTAGAFARHNGNVQTWLLTLVHRRAVAHVRNLGLGNGESRPPAPSPASDLLARLPDEECDAIALAYFGGQTRSQQAAAAGVTTAAIGKRMLSGLTRLRDSSLASIAPTRPEVTSLVPQGMPAADG